ncbi:MAG TPA: PTS sugar transporter subunit IIA [Thermoanaerobaculia bacterium]|nr:PTS sugar transporter subunit IIA [Thermoanaerobaculia bacterium]
MPLSALTRSELIFPELGGHDRETTLRFFADRMAESAGLDADEVYRGLLEREELGSTGIGGGVAIPHARVDGLDRALLAVGLAPDGIPFAAVDGEPVRAFFVVVSPRKDPQQNLRCLAAVSAWIKERGNVEALLAMPSAVAMQEALASDLVAG